MNNDTQNTAPVTQESANTTAPVPTPSTAPAPTSMAATTATTTSKPKNKPKPRRTRTRRRAAASDGSDDEGGGGGGGGNRSDSSLSSRSEVAHSESDDEPDTKVAPTGSGLKAKRSGSGSGSGSKSKQSKSSKAPVFADVSSITPAGWAGKNENGEEVTPVSFEDFNADKETTSTPVRATGLSIRGRGKGKVEPATRREYTPEETAKYEAQKAKRKEKLKAKKAAVKEEKQKGSGTTKAVTNGDTKPSEPAGPSTETKDPTPAPAAPSNSQATTKPPKAKGKKRNESITAQDSPVAPTVDEITASTSAVKLDAPSSAPAETTDPAPAVSKPIKATDAAPSADDPQTKAPASVQQQQRQPPRQPRANAQRNNEDPKFTPRAGQFWTHDQRLHEGGNPAEGYNNGPRQMGPPFFRGRAIPRGAFRGTIRGRGRGGFFPNGRGGFVNGPPARGVELSQEESKEEGSSKLAMDREYELAEARDKARAAAATTAPESTSSPAPPTVEDASAKQVQEQGQAAGETPAVSAPVQPAVASSERKWGHEGYEAMTAPASGHLRGAYRGRVRGAGARGRGVFFPRGGHLPFAPPHRQMHPAQLAAARAYAQAQARVASPAAPAIPPTSTPSAAAATTSASQSQQKPVASDHEQMSTQPTADSLLDPADESFKVKFPGSAASTVPAAPSPVVASAPIPPTAPSTKAEDITPEAAKTAPTEEPAAQPPSISAAPSPAPQAIEPQYPSLQSGSPHPVAAVQAQMYTGGSNHSIYAMGSENGSVGSGHFVQHPGQFYAPEFVPSGGMNGMAMQQQQQRPAFYPQHSQRGYPAQSPGFYPPQPPYSPGPYDQHPHPHHPQHAQHAHQRGSFSGAPMTSPQGVFFPQGQVNGYANGRSSPLNPYMNMNGGGAGTGAGGGGFFAPVRGSSKVSIRAPSQNQNGGEHSEAAAAGAGTNGSQSASGSGSTPNGDFSASGGAYQAQHYNPYVQPFVPGQRADETTYYPLANGQQYAWQGYNGEQAYYDGSVNYGY